MATKIDWAAIEPVWRAGLVTDTQICKDFNVSRNGLKIHFAKKGILRGDLLPAVQAKTAAGILGQKTKQANKEARQQTEREQIIEGVLRHEPSDHLLENPMLNPMAGRASVSEQEIIETAAAVQTGVILQHRRDITKLQHLVRGMVDELEAQAVPPEDLARIAELMAMCALGTGPVSDADAEPAKVQGRLDAFRRILGLAPRVETLSKLAGTFKSLVALERQAFGLPSGENGTQVNVTVNDTPPSENETARRVAFVMMQAMQAKNEEAKVIEHEP